MIVRLSFKSPDALDYAWEEQPEEAKRNGISRTEFDAIASKWIHYGEYITVEIDTEAKTCVVVPL